MGAYTCEFGVVHKVCRCPKPHTIKCDKVAEHGPQGPKHRAEFSVSEIREWLDLMDPHHNVNNHQIELVLMAIKGMRE